MVVVNADIKLLLPPRLIKLLPPRESIVYAKPREAPFWLVIPEEEEDLDIGGR